MEMLESRRRGEEEFEAWRPKDSERIIESNYFGWMIFDFLRILEKKFKNRRVRKKRSISLCMNITS